VIGSGLNSVVVGYGAEQWREMDYRIRVFSWEGDCEDELGEVTVPDAS
jgi:hypothetical protein